VAITIDLLDLGKVTLDSSFLVRGRPPGVLCTVPVYAFLLRGAGDPILVDTGMRNPEFIERIGLLAEIPSDAALESQLARFDVDVGDIKLVLQTHLHVDHSGGIHLFSGDTTIVVNRSELDFAQNGTQGFFYAPEDIADLCNREQSGRLKLLDLETSGPVSIAPGIVCEHARGHTPGMMFVRIETERGVATICSDVVYDVEAQLVRKPIEVSNNTTWPVNEERHSIQRALAGTAYLIPSHCCAARIAAGRVIGMLEEGRIP
jgi:glyoxylase-like metal-dependent hydrolase (beta-lactamase superfamily II)